MTVIDEIIARRAHQIAKGYDAVHDDQHTCGEIARGAAAFALAACGGASIPTGEFRRRPIDPARLQMGTKRVALHLPVTGRAIWPWDNGFSASSPRDALIDAAAMIIAEIERLDRAAERNAA